MVVVCVADEFCAAAVAVRLQAGLAEGELWANATPDMATPIASEAEKINRDMDILLISMPRWRGTLNFNASLPRHTYLWRPGS